MSETELALPEMNGLQALLAKADSAPEWKVIAPAIVLAIATGVAAYKDNQHGLVLTEAERLSWAVDEAARHFLLLAATHSFLNNKP
jgi:hypothetical protein